MSKEKILSSEPVVTVRVLNRRLGFTLIEVLIVLSVLAVLAAMLLGNFSRARETSRVTQCDAHLKAIALALDAYRQEDGHFPPTLSPLRTANYLSDVDALHCPADPKDGRDTYADYYVARAPRDSGELPMVVCPLHEGTGNRGLQAFKGRYTTQFATSPAVVEQASAATVQHPKEEKAIDAAAGMEVHGGDRIRTTSGGGAKIRFADGTIATIRGGSDITVLQSFMAGQANAPLYTLVRQTLGDVVYKINPGSKFDVVTPTATAGAHGTEFNIVVAADGTSKLKVIEGKVTLTTTQRTGLAPVATWITITNTGNIIGALLDWLF